MTDRLQSITILHPVHCEIPVHYRAPAAGPYPRSKEARFFDSTRHLWHTKWAQCHRAFVESIKREGVRSPVVISHGPYGEVTIVEGHHRWAAAAALDIEVPCVWRHELPDGVHPWHLGRADLPWADGNVN